MSSQDEKNEIDPEGSSSTLPLLADEEDYHDSAHGLVRKKSRLFIMPWLVHFAIFCTYTIAFFTYSNISQPENCHKSLIYSPAREAIKWEKVSNHNALEHKSPFKGQPRPELDQAWSDLLENSNVRVSEETLRKINRTSIKLSDGSGDYFVGLNVHHHLHCLKKIHRYIYRDYYNVTDNEDMWVHLEHCIEDLRLTLMCRADFSLTTYDWIPDYRRPWPNFDIDYECINWESIDGWAKQHAFSLFDQKSLVHPELGLTFPLINGSIDFGLGKSPQVVDDGKAGKKD